MVTDLEERGVMLLLRVAVNVTDWPTVGAWLSALRESWVG